MNVLFVKNYNEMSEYAKIIISSKILKNNNIKIGFATGSTPLELYKRLINMYKDGVLNFENVTSFNLDEYCDLERSNDQSYYYFMQENLFKHINIDPLKINIPNGCAIDKNKECMDYERRIEESGGIDIQILGIGSNGHIGFNEPKSYFEMYTHVVDLLESTIESNKRFFRSIEDVPKKAITMGIKSIMSAKEIILLCSGNNKVKIINDFFNKKEITPHLPASILHLHSKVTAIIDEDTIKIN